MNLEKYLNTVHMPPNVSEDLVPGITEILNRIPRGWGRWLSLEAGWYPIIVQLNKELSALDPDYKVHQIKEKFGTLRFYFTLSELPELLCCEEWSAENPLPPGVYTGNGDKWAEAHDKHCESEEHALAYDAQEPLRLARRDTFIKMEALVDEAEELSSKTCERCRLPGSLINSNGWLMTLCESCESVPVAR